MFPFFISSKCLHLPDDDRLISDRRLLDIHRRFILSMTPFCLGAVFLLLGCTATQRPVTTFDIDQPKVSRGMVSDDTNQEGLDLIADAIARAEAEARAKEALSEPKTFLPSNRFEIPSRDPFRADLVRKTYGKPEPLAAVSRNPSPPANSGKLIALAKLSPTELSELLASLELKLETEQGYVAELDPRPIDLPAVPSGVVELAMVSKSDGDDLRYVRFGVRRFLSQPSQLWLQGIIKKGDAPLEVNPDIEPLPEYVETLTSQVNSLKQELTQDDLAHRLIQLSYIDSVGAIDALKGLGITTASTIGEVTLPIEFEKLPLVAQMPTPTKDQIALLGSEGKAGGEFGLSISPAVATSLPHEANMSPASQLLVYYHPAHPDQFGRVKSVLDQFIDRPARQIFVEGLVLEIGEDGLDELGVEWQFQEGNFKWTMGNEFPAEPGRGDSFDFGFDDLEDFQKNWTATITALIEEGKAEILSRPSVLTMDNRQATIRVGTDIPVATSQEGAQNSNKISFNFKYIATGISLNIRPRIDEAGDEISMLVDTIVSSPVPNADLELKSDSGQVLASAPTIATRRVQTYARIDNNTPFIIGGLVSKEYSSLRKKVPLLGDIPYLGNLFRTRSIQSKKQEVIIVLTPYILEDDADARAIGRYLPMDEDLFDEFGNKLFRDFYRIRNEDVFDLGFLRENERLRYYVDFARRASEQDFRLATTQPFSSFADDRIPGEHVLIHRMIYDVLKRLSINDKASATWLDDRANISRLILFAGQHVGGYDVEFMDQVLAAHGDGKSYESFFELNPGKAMTLVYTRDQSRDTVGDLNETPIPDIKIVDCPDEAAWANLVWELNQPDVNGSERSTIVLSHPDDLIRLQRAILVKKVIVLNGGRSDVNLKNFRLGKVLLIPEAPRKEVGRPTPLPPIQLIDPEVAQYFYHTEHYYAELIKSLTEAVDAVEAALELPDYRYLR